MGDRKARSLYILGAVVIALLFMVPSGKLRAAENRIRVGYFNMSGYQEITEEGNRWGFGYDLLQEVAKYTGWEYEFVDTTWDECLEMVEKGELDLVTCAKITPERLGRFEFSEHRVGVSCAVFTVKIDNEKYYYNDFPSFDGMKLGMLKGNQTNHAIGDLVRKYGITFEEYIYDTETELKEALETGKIEAIAASNQRVLENEKVIARFDLGAFYGITKKGNHAVMDGFNAAMEQIMLSTPYFTSNLYNKYFGNNTGYKIALTKEEQAYVDSHKVLRLATSPDSEPLSYYDSDGYSGIIIDSIKAMAEEVGMEVEYVETGSYTESLELLHNGQVDMIGDFYSDYSWSERNGVIITNPYMDVQYVQIGKKGASYRPEEIRVATCENYFFNTMYILKHFPEENLVFYDTERECIEAVKKGHAEVTFINQYTAKVLLKDDEFLKLSGNTLYDSTHGLSIAVWKENKILCHILNKAISDLENAQIKQIVEEHTVERSEEVSLLYYIYYNPFEVMIIICTFFLVVVMVLLYFIIVKRKYDEHIYKLAYMDKLTGLGNTHYFEEQAEKRWLEYRGKEIFLLSLDISHFTTINETYGRGMGDLVIDYLGRKLNELFGEDCIIAHSKVDNFLVFGSYEEEEETELLLELIRKQIGVFVYEDIEIRLNYNFGIVRERSTGSTSVNKLTDRAEMARKAAKKESTHTCFFNDEMEQQLLREKMIEDSMKDALANEEFYVYYQPKYCMTNNEIIGAEALVRWNNKEYGFMNPIEFIPIFENSGFIVELDFYVMEQVYRMLRKRLDNGEKVVRVSINQSRVHFAQGNYIDRLNALREKYRIPSNLIELELTESILANIREIREVVSSLKSNGYSLSVDDFGAGYSSLNMLKEIPIDTLKIDKDFLSNEDETGRYRKVIRKVVELAKELNMDIICEGVEKEEQAEFLKSIGCLYAQGYLYARPMPRDEFLRLLS